MPEPTARRRLSPEDRRRELLDAAFDLLRTDGIEGLTMDALAQRAGANKALAYHYFGDREGVLVALAHREYGVARAGFTEDFASGGDLTDQLRRLLERWLRQQDRRVVMEALDAARSPSGALQQALDHEAAAVGAVLSSGLATAGVPAEHAAVAAAAVVGSAREVVRSADLSPAGRARTIELWLTFCRGALAAITQSSVTAGADLPAPATAPPPSSLPE